MKLETVIFDVDGVLIASPHEQAWRAALQELMAGEWRSLRAGSSYAPERFTTEVYQAYVAGKPRLSGAVSVLEYFGIVDAQARAATYAERKQQLIERLIDMGTFAAFDDAVRFALALEKRHFRYGVASSSKNAVRMLFQIDVGHPDAQMDAGTSSVAACWTCFNPTCADATCRAGNLIRRSSCLPHMSLACIHRVVLSSRTPRPA